MKYSSVSRCLAIYRDLLRRHVASTAASRRRPKILEIPASPASVLQNLIKSSRGDPQAWFSFGGGGGKERRIRGGQGLKIPRLHLIAEKFFDSDILVREWCSRGIPPRDMPTISVRSRRQGNVGLRAYSRNAHRNVENKKSTGIVRLYFVGTAIRLNPRRLCCNAERALSDNSRNAR